MPAEVHIVAVGGVTPVGSCSALSSAAVRAGLSRTTLHTREDGSECHVAFVGNLPPGMPRVARMARLLADALSECAASVPSAIETSVWLVLPAGVDPSSVLSAGARFGQLTCSSLRESSSGHAGGLLALEEAAQFIAQGGLEFACIAGVDVRTDEASLAALEQHDKLLLEDNPWGIVPSEAAGVVLLASKAACERLGLVSLARVCGVASETDPAHKTGAPCIGQGLSRACHKLLDALPAQEKIGEIYCDLNSERTRAEDWGYAAPRIMARCRDVGEAITPALVWGDLAHATGPLLLQLPLAAFTRGYARGDSALVWTASDDGKRAAVVLAATNAPKDALRIPPSRRAAQDNEQDAAIVSELLADTCFLYEQRAYLRSQRELTPEAGWAAIESCERRLERRIDMLDVAEDIALTQCAEQSPGPGLAYVLARLWLARTMIEALPENLDALALAQDDVFAAARAALAHAAGPHAARLAKLLCARERSGPLRKLGLALCADVGVAPGRAWRALADDGPALWGELFPRALGRLGKVEDADLLTAWLNSEDAACQQAAAFAFLRLDRYAARAQLWSLRDCPGFLVPLALATEPGEQAMLLETCRWFANDPAACTALGMFGTAEAVGILLERLDAHPCASEAARALHLITGRAVIDDVLRERRLDDDWLSEVELAARQAGDAEVGVEREQIKQLVRTRAGWQPWCDAHAKRFSAEQRARLGMPWGVASSRAVLANGQIAEPIHKLCADELVLRFEQSERLSGAPRVLDLQALAATLPS